MDDRILHDLADPYDDLVSQCLQDHAEHVDGVRYGPSPQGDGDEAYFISPMALMEFVVWCDQHAMGTPQWRTYYMQLGMQAYTMTLAQAKGDVGPEYDVWTIAEMLVRDLHPLGATRPWTHGDLLKRSTS